MQLGMVSTCPLINQYLHSSNCTGLDGWYFTHTGWADCINVLLSEDCKVQLYNGLVGGAHEAIVKDACGAAR